MIPEGNPIVSFLKLHWDTLQNLFSAPEVLFRKQIFLLGGLPSVTLGDKVVECRETAQVLQIVLMAHPDQASSLQGSQGVDPDILAANDLGIGSGWRQSRQNRALLAVVGE